MLFASNHVSYADIAVLGSLIAGSFIAKAEVAHWPLFGWLAKLQRTVFVDRRVRSTQLQRDAMTERLAAGDALILFPEGTSGDGNRVLPFKSALFSAAERMQAIVPIAVQPVSIAYTRLDGMPLGRLLRPFIAWYGGSRIGAAPVDHAGARRGRGGGRVPSAGIYRRLRVAQGAGPLLLPSGGGRHGLGAGRQAAADAAAASRRRRRAGRRRARNDSAEFAAERGQGVTKQVFIKTYGCQMNVYDSARMAELLASLGFARAATAEDADLVILNTCHIREKAAEKVFSELGAHPPLKRQRARRGGPC